MVDEFHQDLWGAIYLDPWYNPCAMWMVVPWRSQFHIQTPNHVWVEPTIKENFYSDGWIALRSQSAATVLLPEEWL